MLDGNPTPMYYIPSLKYVIFHFISLQKCHDTLTNAIFSDEDSVGLGLQPTLRVYFDTFTYGEGSIVNFDDSPFWEQNLAELDESTTWSFTRDQSGGLVIIKA